MQLSEYITTKIISWLAAVLLLGATALAQTDEDKMHADALALRATVAKEMSAVMTQPLPPPADPDAGW